MGRNTKMFLFKGSILSFHQYENHKLNRFYSKDIISAFLPHSFKLKHYNKKVGVPARWIPDPLQTAGSCGTPGWRGRSQWPPRPGNGARQWRGGGGPQGVGGPHCWTHSSRHSCRGLGCRMEKKGRRSKRGFAALELHARMSFPDKGCGSQWIFCRENGDKLIFHASPEVESSPFIWSSHWGGSNNATANVVDSTTERENLSVVQRRQLNPKRLEMKHLLAHNCLRGCSLVHIIATWPTPDLTFRRENLTLRNASTHKKFPPLTLTVFSSLKLKKIDNN